MNISEHEGNYKQEMKRRGYSYESIKNYSSNLRVFFGQAQKDHPKNINETDISNNLISKIHSPIETITI